MKSSFLVSLCKKQRKQDVARDFENCGKSVGVMTKPPNVLGQNWTQNWKIYIYKSECLCVCVCVCVFPIGRKVKKFT